MTVQFFLPDGSMVIFQKADTRKYRGGLLPGSIVEEHQSEKVVITVQEFANALFSIRQHLFSIFTKLRLSIVEKPGIRFEANLSGTIQFSITDKKIKLRAGEYHLTDAASFTAFFKASTSCNIFITHYSAELLEQLGIVIKPTTPQKMPASMANLIYEIVQNPFDAELREFYYRNTICEILFLHLTNKTNLPGQLNDKDIEAIYKADAIIASDIHKHVPIEKLARLVGTNAFKLKKGFMQRFGVGVFHRLIYRRMEEAKFFLETTDKSISEIADLAGYDTLAGFVHAFNKRFGMSPSAYRKNNKEKNE